MFSRNLPYIVGFSLLLLCGACGRQRVGVETWVDGTVAGDPSGVPARENPPAGPSTSGLYARLVAPYAKDPAEGWRLVLGQSDQVCKQAGDPLPPDMATAVFYLQQGGVLRPPVAGSYDVVASLGALAQDKHDGGVALVTLGEQGGRLKSLQGGKIVLDTVDTHGAGLVKGTLQLPELTGDFATSSCGR